MKEDRDSLIIVLAGLLSPELMWLLTWEIKCLTLKNRRRKYYLVLCLSYPSAKGGFIHGFHAQGFGIVKLVLGSRHAKLLPLTGPLEKESLQYNDQEYNSTYFDLGGKTSYSLSSILNSIRGKTCNDPVLFTHFHNSVLQVLNSIEQ